MARRWTAEKKKRAAIKTLFSSYYVVFLLLHLRPDVRDVHPVLPGTARRDELPDAGMEPVLVEQAAGAVECRRPSGRDAALDYPRAES